MAHLVAAVGAIGAPVRLERRFNAAAGDLAKPCKRRMTRHVVERVVGAGSGDSPQSGQHLLTIKPPGNAHEKGAFWDASGVLALHGHQRLHKGRQRPEV